jgi:hypothetical protein
VSVTCDSGGYPTSDGNAKTLIYTGTTAYKVTLKNAAGVTIWSHDNIAGALDTTPFAAATFAKTDEDCAADTSNTTLTTDDLGTVRNGNPTGGDFTYTLPSAITAGNGKGVTLRHVGTANRVLYTGVSAQTIDGATTGAITGRYESKTLVSDGANWHVKSDANRSVVGGTIHPQGYLTLTSGTPILAADVLAGTAVYYTPFTGNLLSLYDGTRFVNYEFDELTLTLASQHAISTLYDVFAWLESGVVTIGTGPAWTTITAGSGARGTGAGTTQLTRTKGLYLNTVAMTARNSSSTYSVAALRATYLGSIFIDGTAGQVTCHRAYGQSRKWGVWNAFNRQPLMLRAGDTTTTWAPGVVGPRASNNSAANSLTTFCGLAEELVRLRFINRASGSGGTDVATVGIGVNVTNAFSGIQGRSDTAALAACPMGLHTLAPAIGTQQITAVEQSTGSGTDFFGGEDDFQLIAEWEG